MEEEMPQCMTEKTRERIFVIVKELMRFSIQVYRDLRKNKPVDFSYAGFPLPVAMKIVVQSIINQSKDSAMLRVCLNESLHQPDSVERFTNVLRQTYAVCENNLINQSFIVWATLSCLIAANCCFDGKFTEALTATKQIIYEKCLVDYNYFEFRDLGCDI